MGASRCRNWVGEVMTVYAVVLIWLCSARTLPNGDEERRADEMSPRWIAKGEMLRLLEVLMQGRVEIYSWHSYLSCETRSRGTEQEIDRSGRSDCRWANRGRNRVNKKQ